VLGLAALLYDFRYTMDCGHSGQLELGLDDQTRVFGCRTDRLWAILCETLFTFGLPRDVVSGRLTGDIPNDGTLYRNNF
jgi:hypothetical protein